MYKSLYYILNVRDSIPLNTLCKEKLLISDKVAVAKDPNDLRGRHRCLVFAESLTISTFNHFYGEHIRPVSVKLIVRSTHSNMCLVVHPNDGYTSFLNECSTYIEDYRRYFNDNYRFDDLMLIMSYLNFEKLLSGDTLAKKALQDSHMTYDGVILTENHFNVLMTLIVSDDLFEQFSGEFSKEKITDIKHLNLTELDLIALNNLVIVGVLNE